MQILITLSPCLSAGNCGKSNTKRRKGQGTQTGLPRVWGNCGKNAKSTKPKPSNYRPTMMSRTRKRKSKTRRGGSPPTNEGKPKRVGRKESRKPKPSNRTAMKTRKSKSKTRRGGAPTNEAKSESWLYTLRNTTYYYMKLIAVFLEKNQKIIISLRSISIASHPIRICITHMIWSHNMLLKICFQVPQAPPPPPRSKKEKSTFNLYRLYLYTFIFNKRELKSPPTKFHIHSIHTFIHDVFKSKEKCIPLLRRKKYKGFLYIISGLVD